MVDEALEACPMRRDQDPVEIAGRHRISGMRIAASGNPRDQFFVVAHSVESATGLGIYRLSKELLREPHLEIGKRIHRWQLQTEPKLSGLRSRRRRPAGSVL